MGGYVAVLILVLILKAIYWKVTGNDVPGIIDYTSPFILLNAAIGLLLFSEIQIKTRKRKRLLLRGSSVAFDVYIIHCHLFVLDYVISSNFVWINKFPILLIPLALLGVALICYCILSLVGIARVYIFNKLRIERMFKVIASKIDKIVY